MTENDQDRSATPEGPQRLRVLLVEDSEADAGLVLRELQRAGYLPDWRRVMDAAGLEAALARESWDLVLADYTLPQLDGLDALRIVRATGLDLPFIVISGTIGDELAVRAMKAGAHDYLLKDRLTRLGAAIARELREAEGRRRRNQAELAARAAQEETRRLLAAAKETQRTLLLMVEEQRHTEAALRESESRTRAIVEAAVDAIVTTDEEGRIASFNPAAQRLFGYTVAEIAGRDASILLAAPRPGDRASPGEVIDWRVPGVARETVGRRKDGGSFPISLSVSEFWVGARRGFAGIARDLTEHRRLEEQFRQSQKLEAVGRLAGGVAHDFNNLLGVIMIYSEIASRRLEPGHPSREKITQVMEAAQRASALTRQLLAFSRRQVLEPKVLDVNALLRDFEKMLRRLIGEDVQLLFRPGADLGNVRVDPGQIEQVLMNLAVNARDAMPRGGTLSIETAEADDGEIRANAHWEVKGGRYVRLRVADTGEGMDEATLERIFEPFFTTKPSGVGTGLGMSTVFGIVKQSAGHILVDSAPHRGARFDIYLPRVADSADDRTNPVSLARPAGGETILLVEDNATFRVAISEILRGLGYRVLVAGDADAALELAGACEGPIELLLCDVVMPKTSGPEIAARITASRPGTRVLFMSGYSSEALGNRGTLNPGTQILEKPFTHDDLARRLEKVLGSTARDPGGRQGG